MKTRIRLIPFLVVVAILVLGSCNLPASSPPTPLFPTPDVTLTALFAYIETETAPELTATLPPPTDTALPTEPPAVADTLPPPTDTALPPTATPAVATNTPLTDYTSTPVVVPGVRSGPRFVANYIRSEPTIDGVFDEWDLPRYPIADLVYGGAEWTGDADLSGNFMVGWDDYNLYLAVRVRDDRYVQNASGETLFEGDSLEVQFDRALSNDYYYAVLSPDDYQLGVSPGSSLGSATEAYLWYPRALEGGRSTVKAAATATDNGYRIEVKIPWDVFQVSPVKGRHYGFAVSLSDNDEAGTQDQESMVSAVAGRRLTDPTTWGDLELAGQAD